MIVGVSERSTETAVVNKSDNSVKLLIEDGKNGLLFANENVEDLAKKIAEILSNQNSCKDLTRNAFLRLEKEFSFDSLNQGMSEILQKISTNA